MCLNSVLCIIAFRLCHMKPLFGSKLSIFHIKANFVYIFLLFLYLQRQRDECSDDRRWRDDVGQAAARGIGAACLQTVRLKEETKPGSLEPEHDSSQRNNVSK